MGNIINRRDFFRKVTKNTLPFIAAISAPQIFLSCGKDELEEKIPELGTGGNSGGALSISEASGTIDQYEYVDLGLNVKWARCNLGASTPEDFGSFKRGYAGNTSINDIEQDLYYDEGFRNPGQTISGTKYDPARSAWSSKWRMPNKSDFEELLSYCSYKSIICNGHKGMLFTSTKNGKSIFLPASGRRSSLLGIYGRNENAYYFSGTLERKTGQSSYISLYMATLGIFFANGDDAFHDELEIWEESVIRPVSSSTEPPTTCNGNCTANCVNNSTNNICSNCSSNCSNGCKTQCDYNCAATCSSHCYGSCNDTCGGSCTYLSAGSGCSGCARTCSNRCYQACSYACSSNCQSSCINGSK